VTGTQVLLDEHVGRVFERLLQERGYDVVQAKDQFGEHTSDADLVEWCAECNRPRPTSLGLMTSP